MAQVTVGQSDSVPDALSYNRQTNEEKYEKIWNFKKKFLSLQRERRNQVEPRCAERWHLCDDEQFDLAAWFPSLSMADNFTLCCCRLLF